MKTFSQLKIGDNLYIVRSTDPLNQSSTIYDLYHFACVTKYKIIDIVRHNSDDEHERYVEYKCIKEPHERRPSVYTFEVSYKSFNHSRYFHCISDPYIFVDTLRYNFNIFAERLKWRLDKEREVKLVMPIETKVNNMKIFNTIKTELVKMSHQLTDNITFGRLYPFKKEVDRYMLQLEEHYDDVPF